MENGDVSSDNDFIFNAAGSKNRYSAGREKTCSYSFLFAFEHLIPIMLVDF
jgi:hypothetical protein